MTETLMLTEENELMELLSQSGADSLDLLSSDLPIIGNRTMETIDAALQNLSTEDFEVVDKYFGLSGGGSYATPTEALLKNKQYGTMVRPDQRLYELVSRPATPQSCLRRPLPNYHPAAPESETNPLRNCQTLPCHPGRGTTAPCRRLPPTDH